MCVTECRPGVATGALLRNYCRYCPREERRDAEGRGTALMHDGHAKSEQTPRCEER